VSPSRLRDTVAAHSLPPAGGDPHQDLLGERYGLVHFELLRHFETELGTAMGLSPPEAEGMMRQTVREAFTTPFLMDELLAVSAAHRSTLPDAGHRDYYRLEATRLQTRALTQFNAAAATVSDENGLAMFLFSTFLGQHVLFDTFSSHRDLVALLDKLVQCLSLHRGIAVIADRFWPAIRDHVPHHFGADTGHHQLPASEADGRGTECTGLLGRLGRSELSSASREACRAAVEALQRMLDSQRAAQAPASRRLIAVQEWPVRVPGGYIDLLAQQRPEALVVLAYYSVLLHRARDFWIVGEAGSFLIRAIGQHLGAYWADWLEWPNRMLVLSEAAPFQAPME